MIIIFGQVFIGSRRQATTLERSENNICLVSHSELTKLESSTSNSLERNWIGGAKCPEQGGGRKRFIGAKANNLAWLNWTELNWTELNRSELNRTKRRGRWRCVAWPAIGSVHQFAVGSGRITRSKQAVRVRVRARERWWLMMIGIAALHRVGRRFETEASWIREQWKSAGNSIILTQFCFLLPS